MAKSNEDTTHVMRTLEQKKIPYTAHSYDPEGPIDGVSVAQTLGQPPEQVFKTPPEGTAAPDGLRPRRRRPSGHEEAVPHGVS